MGMEFFFLGHIFSTNYILLIIKQIQKAFQGEYRGKGYCYFFLNSLPLPPLPAFRQMPKSRIMCAFFCQAPFSPAGTIFPLPEDIG